VRKFLRALRATKKQYCIPTGMTLTDDLEREWIKATFYKPV